MPSDNRGVPYLTGGDEYGGHDVGGVRVRAANGARRRAARVQLGPTRLQRVLYIPDPLAAIPRSR